MSTPTRVTAYGTERFFVHQPERTAGKILGHAACAFKNSKALDKTRNRRQYEANGSGLALACAISAPSDTFE